MSKLELLIGISLLKQSDYNLYIFDIYYFVVRTRCNNHHEQK